MKVYVFGTGNYYQHFISLIPRNFVIGLLDNDIQKQGTTLDGIKIYSPTNVDYECCDYVFILINKFESIIEQLHEIGVPSYKIKSYYEIGEIFNIDPIITLDNSSIPLSQWSCRHNKKVLLCAHEFSRTGVPIAIKYLADIYRNHGYSVLFVALIGGNLVEDLAEDKIPYIAQWGALYRSKKIKNIVKDFDIIIAGSTDSSKFIWEVYMYEIPIIWWLHESHKYCYEENRLITNCNNIIYLGGGRRVINRFREYYPYEEIKKVLYCIPNSNSSRKRFEDDGVIRFAVIGSVSERKGQDIFLKAISLIEEREKIEFYIVGRNDGRFIDLQKETSSDDRLYYIEELSEKELEEFMDTIDVLVCPSRDDPMPIVVTQAMRNHIVCIVSNQVGQSEYIIDGINGFVFNNEDYFALTEIMINLTKNRCLLKKIGDEGEKIFEKYFSQERLEKEFEKIMISLNKSW